MRPMSALSLVVLLLPAFTAHVAPAAFAPAPAHGARTADEYEALMVNSIKGWDDFQKRFKKQANFALSKEGEETVLKGTVEAYDVKNSTFEARFSSPTEIKRLTVTFDPANPRDRRLRSDLSGNFAKGQPDLEDWLPKPVRDARDRLLVEHIEVDFAGNAPSKATMRSKIDLGFRPVAGLGIGMDAMEFIFTATELTSRNRVGLTATLAGTVALGGTSTRLSGSITSRESRENWTLVAEVGTISLQPLVEAIAGQAALTGIVIPPQIAQLGLQKTVVVVDQAKHAVSMNATSAMGTVAMKATGGNASAFQLGMAPQAGFKFASLAPELGIMDGLDLENTALVIASATMAADLPAIAAVTGSQVERGVSMLGGFNIRAAAPKIADLLKVDQLKMRGTFGASMANVRLEGKVETQIPLVPNSNVAILKGLVVRMTPAAGGATLALGGLVDIKANRQTLTFGADIGIDFVGPSMFVSGQLTAVDGVAATYWTNPFGIARGLHVKDLGLALGINFGAPIPLPILGLQGELVAGDLNRPDFRGRAAIGIDPADPQKTVIDVGFSELGVRQILTAAAPNAMRSVPRDLQHALDISLKEARLTLVPSPSGADLFGVHYDPGFLVQGQAKIGDWGGELYVAVDYERGLEARATIDPILAEPWFALKGARGAPAPFLNIRLEPGPGSYVAMNGLAMVMGVSAEADVFMYGEGFDVFVGGKVFGGVFDASIEVAGGNLKNGGTLYAVAEMKNDLFRYMTENASRQIDAATKDMQAEITKAQRDVSRATAEVRSFDSQIAQYRAQLEANRNQVCLDIKNGNADVRRAEAQVAAERNRLNGIPNDPGVVAARNRLTTAEADVARARQAVNGVEQDPGVVAARNRLTAAIQTLEGARAKVAAIDVDPGVQRARADLNNAQARVNSLTSSIDAATSALNSLNARYNALTGFAKLSPEAVSLAAQITAKEAERVGLLGSRATANGVLNVSRDVMNGSIRAAQDVANAGITASQGTVNLSQQAYDGAISAARQVANGALQAAEGTVNASRQAYDGLIQAGTVAAQTALRVAEGTLQASQATAAAAHSACVAAPIEVDPRLATLIASQETSIGVLKVSNAFLEGVKQTATGTMVAADWIVKNGNPLGVVNIEYAKFEGCLATMEGGKIGLEIRGKFAGQPINGQLDFNFASPAEAVAFLASQLVQNKSVPPVRRGAGCTKPTFVGRPGRPTIQAAARVPATPADLKGTPPEIAKPTVPAGLGAIPKRG